MAIFKAICSFCLILALLLSREAQAGQLADRLAKFPHWENKPPISSAEGDLVYPDWIAGKWQVTSTLVDLVAPLAPDVVTPGFESNRQHLHQPVRFLVRFQEISPNNWQFSIFSRQKSPLQTLNSKNLPVVADRTFNGLNIAKAYLGEPAVQSVKVDPDSPNRQITSLSGGRQLVSVVTGRGSESADVDQFIATEVSQQIFRGTPQLYFNTVETTTAYQLLTASPPAITADQITAVYLSPQDPDYFKALEKPVALYRYRLKLVRVE